MPRVLVVSRNPAMAMALSGPDHDVTDLRPADFGGWIQGGASVDAMVLDLDSPALALAAVTNLRAHDKLSPVLLVASDRPGWTDPALHDLAATEVLQLPVDRSRLQSGLGSLLRVAPAPAGSAPAPGGTGPDDLSAVPDGSDLGDVVDELLGVPDPAPVSEEELDSLIIAPHRYEEELPPLPLDPSEPERTPGRAAVPQRPTVPRSRQAGAHPPASEASDLVQALRRQAHAEARVDADDAAALVRALHLQVARLYGVPETGNVVITGAVERTAAGGGALLVPDGDRWRVAGGVNLRTLEHRYELDEDSWLIQKIVREHKGVIIEDSDIARHPLAGAPLASWRHLLAAPVPEVAGLLLLARQDDPPFDEDDLAVLAVLGEEAGPLLAAAVETRALARALAGLADE